MYLNALEDFGALLTQFKPLEPATEYYQLLVHLSLGRPAPRDPSRFRLLGYDLSDETHTSSLLNCGPWTGELAPFTLRLNPFGLLAQEDARMAQALLPDAWGNDPHSIVEVWALFEISPP